MADLPPPNYAADLPEDEPIHPEPTPIIPDPISVQPDGYLSDVEVEVEDEEEDLEEEPNEQPVLEPNNINEFALHPNPQQKDEDEMEVDDNGEEDGEDNIEDDAEVINLYEEVDPLNRPPIGSNEESEFAPLATPVVDANLELIPPTVQFSGNFHVGESSSTRIFLLMYDRYNTERRMAKKFKEDDLRMNRHEYDISALDTVVREKSFDHLKMMQLVESLSRRFDEFQNGKVYKEIEALREELRGVPSKPPTDPAFVPRLEDPYVITRDAATTTTRDDDGDDTTTSMDPQPSKPHGSPSNS
ncbi:hypothetical protein Tco_1345613 [Tanacetum coccineum]